MSQLLVIGISVCVLLCLGMIADRLLSGRVAWQDLAWRLTLLAVLMLPIFTFLVGSKWPGGLIQVPVLAAQMETPIDSSVKRDLNSNRGVDNFDYQPSTVVFEDAESKQPAQNRISAEFNKSKASDNMKVVNHLPNQASRPKTKSAVVDSELSGFSFSWSVLAKAIWLLGSLCFLVRYVVGWCVIRLVASHATNATNEPNGWAHAIDKATSLAGLDNRIVVRASDKISTPMLVGVIRPLVLVPELMLQLSPSDARVRAALSHEAMHIRRADAHWNFLLFICLLVWWPIPMVHWMKKRMFWLRELLCDADVAAEMGAANYAESLLRLTQLPSQRRIGMLAVPMHSQEQSLESRVKWILELPSSVPNPSRLIRGVVWCCLVVALLGFTTIKLVPASSPSSLGISPELVIPISDQDQEKKTNEKAEKKKPETELRGLVKNSEGNPVAGAIVYLRWNDGKNTLPRETFLVDRPSQPLSDLGRRRWAYFFKEVFGRQVDRSKKR